MSRAHLVGKYFHKSKHFVGFFDQSSKTYWRKLCTSSSSSDDDSKKTKLDEKKRSEEALKKLNKLLMTMTEDPGNASKTQVNLAQPPNKRRRNTDETQKLSKTESFESQVMNATEIVAETLGGDVKQTQSELLTKLLTTHDQKPQMGLNELVQGMKITSDKQPTERSKAAQVRRILQTHKSDKNVDVQNKRLRFQSSQGVAEKVNLFDSEPLGIFTKDDLDLSEGIRNDIWNRLHEKDLKLAVTHPPANYFQEMILWTEQGKVWKFPIDNEQGIEEEKKVSFAEHVFLEKHLESWCPAKGPLRHFMELVCVGLSKNPYLTVEAKREHIQWFENYFKQKQQLLEDTGLIQEGSSKTIGTVKSIEQ